jgi:uncharacterized protein (TIGR00255 family)
MTGFGKSTASLPGKKITIELKALNSKQFDLTSRMPPAFKEVEMNVRGILLKELERGKVDCVLQVEYVGADAPTTLNMPVIINYHRQICTMADSLGIDMPTDWFQVLLRLPEAVRSDTADLSGEERVAVTEALEGAIKGLKEFRVQEGAMLENLFRRKIANIRGLLTDIEACEPERLERIKARLTEHLEKALGVDYDKNRFEQELIYYIEKYDVSEEKNRLANHLNYFIETMDGGHGQGKKLGFIAQEIGREINTLGSKSNLAEMQQIVVRMKDELEQMKEQILNVL